jgi:hypothetical protein
MDLRRLLAELDELGDQLQRQVVDCVVAQILEHAQDGALARAAQAGHYDELGLSRDRLVGLADGSMDLPLRRYRPTA